MDSGKYSNGIIAKSCKKGQIIDVEVVLTTSRLGYFQFHIEDFTNKVVEGDSIGILKGYELHLVLLILFKHYFSDKTDYFPVLKITGIIFI